MAHGHCFFKWLYKKIRPPPEYNCFEDNEQKGIDPGPELQLCAYTRDYNRKGWITKSRALRMRRAACVLCDASCMLSVYKEADFFPQNTLPQTTTT